MTINTDHLYEFCLDWQMNCPDSEEREQLKEEFGWRGWNFEEFKREASKLKWWVNSMSILERYQGQEEEKGQ